MYRAVLIPIVLISVQACTTVTGSRGAPSGVPATAVYMTQAVLGRCPSLADQAELATTVAATAIATGVSRIAAAIRAAADEETRQVIARRNIEVSRRGFGPCLLIARGWFLEARSTINGKTYRKAPASTFKHDEGISRIHQQGLLLASTPDFFFEGRFKTSSDKSVMSLQPIYAYLGTPIVTNSLNSNGDRNILVSFAVTKATKSADLTKGQGSTVILGKLETNAGKSFVTNESDLFTCDQKPCSAAKSPQLRIRGPQESEWFGTQVSEEAQPMTLQALVSETRGADEFLSFIGEVFGGVSDELTERLQASLIPSVGDAEAESRRTEAENALSAYESAYADALLKLDDCLAGDPSPARAAAAKVAMRVANQKARAVQKTEPFPPAQINAIVVRKGTCPR